METNVDVLVEDVDDDDSGAVHDTADGAPPPPTPPYTIRQSENRASRSEGCFLKF